MSMTKQEGKTKVEPVSVQRVEYEQREALFGIIKWYEKLKTTEIAKELHIMTEKTPRHVFINGQRFIADNKV